MKFFTVEFRTRSTEGTPHEITCTLPDLFSICHTFDLSDHVIEYKIGVSGVDYFKQHPLGCQLDKLVTKWNWDKTRPDTKDQGYVVYTEVDLADTTRDPSNVHTEILKTCIDLDTAIDFANGYIKENFFHKNTRLRSFANGVYSATDFTSYGKTIIVKSIK